MKNIFYKFAFFNNELFPNIYHNMFMRKFVKKLEFVTDEEFDEILSDSSHVKKEHFEKVAILYLSIHPEILKELHDMVSCGSLNKCDVDEFKGLMEDAYSYVTSLNVIDKPII